jgi:hypothetical protein
MKIKVGTKRIKFSIFLCLNGLLQKGVLGWLYHNCVINYVFIINIATLVNHFLLIEIYKELT